MIISSCNNRGAAAGAIGQGAPAAGAFCQTASCIRDGACASTTKPIRTPNAGSIESSVPNAVWVMRLSASISSPNAMTGVISAMPAAAGNTHHVSSPQAPEAGQRAASPKQRPHERAAMLAHDSGECERPQKLNRHRGAKRNPVDSGKKERGHEPGDHTEQHKRRHIAARKRANRGLCDHPKKYRAKAHAQPRGTGGPPPVQSPAPKTHSKTAPQASPQSPSTMAAPR